MLTASSSWEDIKEHLPSILDEFDQEVASAGARVSIKGKTGATALKEQCAWPLFYSVRKAELGKLVKIVNARVEATRGFLYKQYTEGYSRALPERAKDKYIDNETDFLRIYSLLLEVQEMYDKYSAICDAFDRRGFALRDWTTLKTIQSQDDNI